MTAKHRKKKQPLPPLLRKDVTLAITPYLDEQSFLFFRASYKTIKKNLDRNPDTHKHHENILKKYELIRSKNECLKDIEKIDFNMNFVKPNDYLLKRRDWIETLDHFLQVGTAATIFLTSLVSSEIFLRHPYFSKLDNIFLHVVGSLVAGIFGHNQTMTFMENYHDTRIKKLNELVLKLTNIIDEIEEIEKKIAQPVYSYR